MAGGMRDVLASIVFIDDDWPAVRGREEVCRQ